MKKLGVFLKATTLSGLFVVLPVLIIIAVLTKVILAVHDAAQLFMEKLAGKESDAAHFPLIFTLLLLLGISFLFGVAMISQRGQAAGRWFEAMVLFRVPGYAAVRAIVGGLVDSGRDDAVKPGLLRLEDGIECFVFVIENHGGDLLTVYVPGSPNPASGNVQIVRKDLVRLLNVRLTHVGQTLQQWGVGSAKLLAKHTAATTSSPLPSLVEGRR